MAPHIGSTRGGAWATITGADFQPGATVRLGEGAVTAWVRDSATITISTTAHAAGTVDVIVTNDWCDGKLDDATFSAAP